MTDLATASRGVRVRALVVEHTAGAAGIGELAVEREAGTTLCGDGPTAAVVRVTRFESTRAATGRRSPDQVAAYEWANERAGLARPDLLVVAPFTPRLAALVE